MSWKATTVVEERLKFIAAYLEDEEPFVTLCERFGIARSKGYKWVNRYHASGVDGLHDQSRRPLSNSRAILSSTAELLVSLRRDHPTWGPKKLVAVLGRENPSLQLPALSTVGELLKRRGLLTKKRRRSVATNHGLPLAEYDAPNAIWCADFKGWFLVNARRCHPLTISDGYSRYLLRCIALQRTLHRSARRVFESAFREYGLPLAIRTDNGPPFVSVTTGGLSRLAVWWIKLGIRPERILPGRPDQNGRHERMHRTLAAEATRPPRRNFAAQQRTFDAFRLEYNTIRPHEALGQSTPAQHYERSQRQYPASIEDPSYPKGFSQHRAYPNGVISVGQSQWYVGARMGNELIGLDVIADGCWKVYFGPVALGLIDLRRRKRRYDRNFGLLLPLPGHPRRHNRGSNYARPRQ